MPLTDKQIQAFDFIVAFMDKYHRAPTLNNIRQGLNIKTETEAHRYVRVLVEKGFLFRLPGARQSIRIIKYPEGATLPSTQMDKPADPAQAQRERIAYARGVSAGRAQIADPNGVDALALKQAYDKGFKDGMRKAALKRPTEATKAFERGIEFGRKELKEELTMAKRDAKINAGEISPLASFPPALPFLRRSD